MSPAYFDHDKPDPKQFRVRGSPSDAVVPFKHEHDDEHDSLREEGSSQEITAAKQQISGQEHKDQALSQPLGL